MSLKKIDPTIPYIKLASMTALEDNFSNTGDVYEGIKNSVWRFYESKGIKLPDNQTTSVEKVIYELSEIQKKNNFPAMRANWTQFPNNIGHIYTLGCFRCHDGKHVSNEGKVISRNCNVCHTIINQKGLGGAENVVNEKGEIQFMHPGGIDKFVKDKNCPDCHGVKRN
jgi:hypothetical protein